MFKKRNKELNSIFLPPDSLFIILRKRDQQLSFLHIYHHATMFPLWWIGARYVAGGSSFLGALFNCCVHVVMYSYYAMSAMGDRVKKFLWWKKYLTALQVSEVYLAILEQLLVVSLIGEYFVRFSGSVFILSTCPTEKKMHEYFSLRIFMFHVDFSNIRLLDMYMYFGH